MDNINREVKPDPKLHENLRQEMLNNIAAMGVTLTREETHKDELLENVAEMAIKENDKRRNQGRKN